METATKELDNKTILSKGIKVRKQIVLTVFKAISNEKQVITYPELDKYYDDGFFIEDFKQTNLGNNSLMITFILKTAEISMYR